MAAKLLLTMAVLRLVMTLGLKDQASELVRLGSEVQLSVDPSDRAAASIDFGKVRRTSPLAVMYPDSADDVARLVRAAYRSEQGFTVSARGEGHSTNGQAQTAEGVVVQMSRRQGKANPPLPMVSVRERYVDVWGGELWVDLLNATLEHGLAPKSWTDYLHLSVGGTLSNAGISGQAYHHGPQISNVYELDVVTGKGELLTCSETSHAGLFHAVLGGLGQFGIITRARIALEPAPRRVKWIRALYSDFWEFTNDQEYLISLHGPERFDYVEGSVNAPEGLINNWRSTSFVPMRLDTNTDTGMDMDVEADDTAFDDYDGPLYCLEIAKNYDASNGAQVDKEMKSVLKVLRFIRSSAHVADVSYVEFLERVHVGEMKLRARGLWDAPHPWLNLFVPKSRIVDFDAAVFKTIVGDTPGGPLLVYPMNKSKWDPRWSVVIPQDDEVFYLVALLATSDENQSLEYQTERNRRILRFCDDTGIRVKQYLPLHTTHQEWKDHFGEKWAQFYTRKMEYDPRCILATGQRIFHPALASTAIVASIRQSYS